MPEFSPPLSFTSCHWSDRDHIWLYDLESFFLVLVILWFYPWFQKKVILFQQRKSSLTCSLYGRILLMLHWKKEKKKRLNKAFFMHTIPLQKLSFSGMLQIHFAVTSSHPHALHISFLIFNCLDRNWPNQICLPNYFYSHCIDICATK